MPQRRVSRIFLLIAAAVAAASALCAQGQAPPALPKLEKVKDDLYLIANSDVTPEALRYWGGNITVLVTKDGAVLIDAKYARAHDDVVAKVKSLTDKPIKYVILTHNHGDHSEGAPALEAMGATVIISNDDRENLARAQSGVAPAGYVYGAIAPVSGGQGTATHAVSRPHARRYGGLLSRLARHRPG